MNDVPISIKILIPPLVALLALIGLVALAVWNSTVEQRLTERLDRGIYEQLRQGLSLKDTVTLHHARLADLIVTAANETDSAKIGSTIDALLLQFKGSLADAAALQAHLANEDDVQALMQQVSKALASYTETARSVIDFARSDAGYAIIMMSGAKAQFNELRDRLDALSGLLASRRTTLVDRLIDGMQRTTTTFIVVAGAAILLCLTLTSLVARATVRPLRALTDAMKSLSHGDLETEVLHQGRGDEFGAMAKALEVFKQSAVENRTLDAKVTADAETQVRHAAALEQATNDFRATAGALVDGLASAATVMEAAAESMSGIAARTDRQSAEVTAASEQSSANMQAVSAATEQLSSSTQEIGRQVSHATEIARQASEHATNTDSTMRELVTGAQKIGEVVTLIQQIAGQTNLLAFRS